MKSIGCAPIQYNILPFRKFWTKFGWPKSNSPQLYAVSVFIVAS